MPPYCGAFALDTSSFSTATSFSVTTSFFSVTTSFSSVTASFSSVTCGAHDASTRDSTIRQLATSQRILFFIFPSSFLNKYSHSYYLLLPIRHSINNQVSYLPIAFFKSWSIQTYFPTDGIRL